ncbi:MAG: response regulator [Candidatus Omnitrophota bacterium]
MRTIMVVDDEPEIVSILGEFLEREGFRVIRCSGGKEALGTLKNEPSIELAVLDSKMPEVNGAAVLKELESMKLPVRTVMLTGSADWKATHPDVKCDMVMIKPVELDELLDAINTLLGSRI